MRDPWERVVDLTRTAEGSEQEAEILSLIKEQFSPWARSPGDRGHASEGRTGRPKLLQAGGCADPRQLPPVERGPFLPLLDDLITGRWHYSHEDLVQAIESVRSDATIPFLEKAISVRPSYLDDVDGSEALIRKAIWAIWKVSTPASQAALQRLAQSEAEAVKRPAPLHASVAAVAAARSPPSCMRRAGW